MNSETLSRGGTPVHAEDAEDYRVTDAKDIQHLLEQLRDAHVPVVLTAPDGTSYTTLLWSCDARSGHLCFSADEHHAQPGRLIDADDVAAVAYLDSIRLQFEIAPLLLVHGDDVCTLQAGWPRTLYRFQRRSGFRVRTLDRPSPVASLRHPAIPEMALALRIIDVSIGGCSLLLPPDVPPLQPGTRIQSVHVDLDADTRFTTGLVLHHVSSLHESRAHRIGCEWLALDGPAQRALQRYIDATQKRRRMFSLGS